MIAHFLPRVLVALCVLAGSAGANPQASLTIVEPRAKAPARVPSKLWIVQRLSGANSPSADGRDLPSADIDATPKSQVLAGSATSSFANVGSPSSGSSRLKIADPAVRPAGLENPQPSALVHASYLTEEANSPPAASPKKTGKNIFVDALLRQKRRLSLRKTKPAQTEVARQLPHNPISQHPMPNVVTDLRTTEATPAPVLAAPPTANRPRNEQQENQFDLRRLPRAAVESKNVARPMLADGQVATAAAVDDPATLLNQDTSTPLLSQPKGIAVAQASTTLVNSDPGSHFQLENSEPFAEIPNPATTHLLPPGATPAGAALPARDKIFFRPAVVDVNQQGQPVLRPNVRVANRPDRYPTAIETAGPPPAYSELPGPNGGAELPSAVDSNVVIPEGWSVPFVSEPHGEFAQTCNQCAPRLGPCQKFCCRVRARLNGPCAPQPGIGTERVMHAISFIDTSQPMNNFRMRFDAGYNWESPDRAEYFWGKINGNGPSGQGTERSVDFQDIRMYLEQGGDKFSIGTEIPIRVVEPDVYDGSGGIGDITITAKTLFIDGRTWQIANLFRTYVNSGDASAGLGTGHTSIEPGFAWRMKWSDITYFHGDIKYWVPLGGDTLHAGEALIYGLGMSHVWRENDSFAIMPTLELVGYTFQDGQKTFAGAGMNTSAADVDSDGILNIHPGVRWVWDNGGDCGVKELGIFGGFSATSDHLYESLLRAEVRFLW